MVTKTNHKTKIELALCRRDYDLLARYHGELLTDIESAIAEDIEPAEIRRWVMGMVSEPDIVQRCYNAARYIYDNEH